MRATIILLLTLFSFGTQAQIIRAEPMYKKSTAPASNPEMMPAASTWAASGLAYWNTHNGNWSGNGTVATSNGSNGFLTKNAFWAIGVAYTVTVTATCTSGTLYPAYDGTNYNVANNISSSVLSVTFDYTPLAEANMYFYSVAFNGTITGISIKIK